MTTTLVNCAVKTSRDFPGARIPQGCMYLLGATCDAGLEVDFRDYQLEPLTNPLDVDTFVEFLKDDNRVIAISCMSNLLPLVVEATRRLKLLQPDKVVLLGGIGPSGVAEELMTEFQHIDIIARGEGEETFVELVRAFSTTKGSVDLGSIPGILYRRSTQDNYSSLVRAPDHLGCGKGSQRADGDWSSTGRRGRKEHLDQLSMPAYERVDPSDYETVGVQTARGCPFPCKFCDVSAYWGRRSTYRSLPLVFDELAIVENMGYERVTLLDDTFILRRPRVDEFCKGWRDSGLKIQWSAYCRVDLVDERMADDFAESGCYRVFLGLESGSNKVLERMSKRMNWKHLEQMVSLMADRFIVRCNMIWGFPFETMDDLKQTVDALFWLRSLGTHVSLGLLSPLPLSALYESKQYEIVMRDDIQSSVVSSRFYLPDGSELIDGKPDELVDLIKRHPRIFPGFYTFADPLFEQKYEYLTSMGLDIETLTSTR